MRYRRSIFGGLLKPIDRRQFDAIVDRHRGDAYDKSFDSWTHLVSLVCGQLTGASSLRELEAIWQANAHHHHHLGVSPLHRSTLSDANRRRPPAIFIDLVNLLIRQVHGPMRREGGALVRLIDSTPIPLRHLADWVRWNGRTRGLKLHVVYDPEEDMPERLSITAANVNDVSFRSEVAIEPGTTYVYDKAYCHYGWWTEIDRAGATFVTRRKINAHFRTVRRRPVDEAQGDGFTILSDAEVRLATPRRAKLDIPIRRIRLRRHADGKTMDLLTNDQTRSATEIAGLYKARWQIELLFRWIKQHLNIRRFLGTSENAIRLQILAAMIAFLLLRLAARLHRLALQPIRFAQLVGQCLFLRKTIDHIDKPPPVNPSTALRKADPNQLCFDYA
ncbi:MAG TPA: IS4 family transposase [Terriglobales bacterium]|nr:IS4 family transposase [Terriglobales bacterium]